MHLKVHKNNVISIPKNSNSCKKPTNYVHPNYVVSVEREFTEEANFQHMMPLCHWLSRISRMEQQNKHWNGILEWIN